MIPKPLVWILVVTACTTVVKGVEPVKDAALGVTFPERIGMLVFQGRELYQRPELGYSLRYQDQRLFKVDVYVYDNGLDDIGDGVESKRVKDEFASVISIFSIFEQMGTYKGVKELARGTTSFPSASLQFLWHRCQYRQPTGEAVAYPGLRVSETYLSAKGGKFIKVRLTLKKEQFAERRTEVSGFVKELAKMLSAEP